MKGYCIHPLTFKNQRFLNDKPGRQHWPNRLNFVYFFGDAKLLGVLSWAWWTRWCKGFLIWKERNYARWTFLVLNLTWQIFDHSPGGCGGWLPWLSTEISFSPHAQGFGVSGLPQRWATNTPRKPQFRDGLEKQKRKHADAEVGMVLRCFQK